MISPKGYDNVNHTSSIKYIENPLARNRVNPKAWVDFLDNTTIMTVRKFHESFPQYKKTPLVALDKLAEHLGVSKIWVKDESKRFDLNAFKVLGGCYAVGKYLSQCLRMDLSNLSYKQIRSEELKEKLGVITFVTATDGNHGRGIAWAAKQLGHKSVVFMPKGSSKIRLYNIRREGAEAFITDLNYDDTVRLATQYAKDHGGVLLQDSAWEGYTEIPTWIMQGYTTIMDETLEQIQDSCAQKPTHLFLQAGVGSFAGSMLGCLIAKLGDHYPITAIVEPESAACIYKSAFINDGNPHAVTGFMPTIMAGLACGEPSIVSWDILRDYSDLYFSCPDSVAAKGMRILGNPLQGDPTVLSGESGAVGLGLLCLLLENDDHRELVRKLKLDENSRILLISTEGDTDPQSYRSIVWNGQYPAY